MVYILPDRGAENAIPAEEWQNMNEDFQKIFKADNVADKLIVTLNKWQPVFAKYIPPVENDINELPDDMDIDL